MVAFSVTFREITEELIGPSHDANLAEFLDEADLQSMAAELIGDFDGDKDVQKRMGKLRQVLTFLVKLKKEASRGGASVSSIVLTESVVNFRRRLWASYFLRLDQSLRLLASKQ